MVVTVELLQPRTNSLSIWNSHSLGFFSSYYFPPSMVIATDSTMTWGLSCGAIGWGALSFSPGQALGAFCEAQSHNLHGCSWHRRHSPCLASPALKRQARAGFRRKARREFPFPPQACLSTERHPPALLSCLPTFVLRDDLDELVSLRLLSLQVMLRHGFLHD